MQRLRKTAIRRWRYYLFYAFCLAALLPCSARAQVGSKAITFEASGESLTSAINRLSKASGINIGYPGDVKQYRKITLSKASRTVLETLKALLKETELDCKPVGEMLVVFRKPQTPVAPSKKLINVNGKVVDEAGQPLPAISILLQGTDRATTTNSSGSFELYQVPEDAPIIAQGIGFPAQAFNATTVMVLRLSRSVSDLDEVQVIAYGTTTKRFNTGSVTTIKAEDIGRQPVSNPLAALQGHVPGLIITQTSGVPGSGFNVQIRGQSSLDPSISQNNPLFVIDGVPFETGNLTTNQLTSAANNPTSQNTGGLSALNSINPQDIESVEVLKDADATSIYGSRGANGVILITTKKGSKGKTDIIVNGNTGFSRIGRSMNMLTTSQYVQMRREALNNDGLTPSADASNAGYAPDIMILETNVTTDFKDLLLGGTARYNNIQVAMTGGNSFTQFRLGANYHRETTVYPGDFSDKIGSANFNLNHRSANGKLTVQFSGIYSSDRNSLPRVDMARYINLIPNLKLYTESGDLKWDDLGVTYRSLNNQTNPLAFLYQNYKSTNDNLIGNLNLAYQIIDGLKIKANLGYNTFNTQEKSTVPTKAIDPNTSTLPSASFAYSNNRSWIIEPQLEYNMKNEYGSWDILLGTTFQDKSSTNNLTNGTNYNSDLLLNSISAAGNVTAINNQLQYRYSAAFGRLSYNLKNKYLLNLTGRRDGSSRFGPGRQWANFGAVGAGWIFSSESFAKTKLSFLSFGKLRASYGSTGNDQIGDYQYLNLWSNTSVAYTGIPGLMPTALYNPDYGWEVNKKFEAALELGFLNDRILFNGSYYDNRSSNQLIRYLLPTQTGSSSIIKNFPGLVANSGIELTINSKNISKQKFSWTSAFNISFPKNKLLSFPDLARSSYSTKYEIGKSLTLVRAFEYLGVDTQTGLYSFKDVNGDGVIYDGDYLYFSNLDPKYYGGLQNNIKVGAFDCSFFFQFTKQEGQNYLAQLGSTTPGRITNQPDLVLDRWVMPGDQTAIQKFTSLFDGPASTTQSAMSLSTGRYTDASYIKLRNLNLGCEIPAKTISRTGLSSCRLYISVQNIFTITNYKGADPEVQDFYRMPPLRTFVGGVQIIL